MKSSYMQLSWKTIKVGDGGGGNTSTLACVSIPMFECEISKWDDHESGNQMVKRPKLWTILNLDTEIPCVVS